MRSTARATPQGRYVGCAGAKHVLGPGALVGDALGIVVHQASHLAIGPDAPDIAGEHAIRIGSGIGVFVAPAWDEEALVVEMESEISWTSDRVTERGKKLLEEFGLGVPVQIDGVLNFETIEQAVCPHCSSSNTTLRSMFGSTLCRSIHYCNNCKQGFERFKPV